VALIQTQILVTRCNELASDTKISSGRIPGHHNGDCMATVCQSARILVKKRNILEFEGVITYRAERASIKMIDHLGLCREITAVC
jgi:hypothetical protein